MKLTSNRVRGRVLMQAGDIYSQHVCFAGKSHHVRQRERRAQARVLSSLMAFSWISVRKPPNLRDKLDRVIDAAQPAPAWWSIRSMRGV